PEVLKFALSKDVRSQDTYVILASFGSNSAGRHIAWKFNKGQFKELFKRYEGGSVSLLGHILEGSVTGFNTAEDLADVKAFFAKHPVQGIERTMKQALEIIHSNIRWTAKSRKDVESWLLR
ncbi:MAG: ERAP1-like C-terminal domain-containing protein, partial [Candidatus Omnitrophica bacterium]|nr:ERAP1-like C-terminal domain-containing protein [Candidatus Omnitrophota bacterium]